jgi:hypothetical protein
VWRELARNQDGILTRAQAIENGVSPAAIIANLKALRWRRVHHGVYATLAGPLPPRSQFFAPR